MKPPAPPAASEPGPVSGDPAPSRTAPAQGLPPTPESTAAPPSGRGVIGGVRRHETPEARASQASAKALLASGGPVGLEVGFGYGTFLLSAAAHNPAARFLGLEVRERLVRLATSAAQQRGVHNVAWLEADARYILPRLLEPSSLRQVWLLFPDPWWKERHWKRRGLLTPAFITLLESLLEQGGVLTFKTDVRMRAELLRAVMDPLPGFAPAERDAIDPGPDATTKRQRRCRHEGVSYLELRWRRVLAPGTGG